MPGAFSLIEMLMVVSVIGIMAGIAVPTMGPQVDIARIDGSGEIVASFLARAQAEAMASRRCVRVWIDTSGDTTSLVADRLNTFDCDIDPSTAPKIDGAKGLWINIVRREMEYDSVRLEWDTKPSETLSSNAPGSDEPDQLRFRPSGRLFSADTTITDDDGVLKLTHTDMEQGIPNVKKILIEAQGLICVLPRGVSPSGTGNNLSCP